MNLISKKDLLAITGISYGQLYRWKRERLIPEEWFIKQSSYTGQETFFPREQILSRVKSILEMKDEYSLEDLAKLFSPDAAQAAVTVPELVEMGALEGETAGIMEQVYGSGELDLWDAAFALAWAKAAGEAGINREQTAGLLCICARSASKRKSVDAVCTVFLAEQEYHAVFAAQAAALVFDSSIDPVCSIPLSQAAEELKLKYKKI